MDGGVGCETFGWWVRVGKMGRWPRPLGVSALAHETFECGEFIGGDLVAFHVA